jgi:rubrerythrin
MSIHSDNHNAGSQAMKFTFAVKHLSDILEQAREQLTTCRTLYTGEGINDATLMSAFTTADEQITLVQAAMKKTLSANERRFDIIEFLTDALTMETTTIAELHRCITVLPAGEITDAMRQIIREEKQHEQALARSIRQLGGEPRVNVDVAPITERSESILDVLRRHRESELTTLAHYELGLSRFDEPEFQWVLGQLAISEKQHVGKLDHLVDAITQKYPSADLLPAELKNITWTDPYMGPRGDRPWIE